MDSAVRCRSFFRVHFRGCVHAFFRLAALLTFGSIDLSAFTPAEQELPLDETEAELFLEEGILDSAVWQVVLPFYRRPLEVPSGELAQLEEAFPELSGLLPMEQSELDRYLPWGDREIGRFFKDYPILAGFKPILQFDHHPARRNGAVSFYMNRSGYDTSANHSARLLITPVRQAGFNGTVDFTSNYARWERRSFLFKPVSWMSLHLGNALLFPDQGMWYGHFPADTSSRTDPKANWLYGETPTWNGLALRCSGTKKRNGFTPGLSSFFHERTSERIVGCEVAGTVKKTISVSLGTSRLSSDTMDAASLYFHGSVHLRSSLLNSEFYCGMEHGRPSRIPFSWSTVYHRDKRFVELRMIRLPARFSAPRSALLRRFVNEMEFDDTIPAAVSLVRITTGQRTGCPVRVRPQAELWFNGTDIDHGTFYLQGDCSGKSLKSTLLLSQEFGSDDGSARWSIIQGRLEWKVIPQLCMATRHRCSFTGSGKVNYRGSIAPAILFFSFNRIEPSITFTAKGKGAPSILAGCRQKATLFERTYTEFIFQRTIVPSSSRSGFRVEGKASFFY
ncbi:MAG: hypothetical protein JXA18_14985 [Chitinispirillaceae bacterium]|nr:hypothetical protein [Chitinispirillaceae bacterium]